MDIAPRTASESPPITVVGGGLTGLVAAIACKEIAGAQGTSTEVTLHEATEKLGGKARTLSRESFVTNKGPHALYGGKQGKFVQWLNERGLLPDLIKPSAQTFHMRLEDKMSRLPLPLLKATCRLFLQGADASEDYRAWATRRLGDKKAIEAAIGFASLPSFHHDPGELAADFTDNLINRVFWGGRHVRYVRSGWGELVNKLEHRAEVMGVEIVTGSRVTELPQSPVILAIPQTAASILLERNLTSNSAQTVLLDIGANTNDRNLPANVLDLTNRIYASRVTALDQSLAPHDTELIQASAGLRPGETREAAIERIESFIDATFPGFLNAEIWRREPPVLNGANGSISLPGDRGTARTSIIQAYNGGRVFLAGDTVQAPSRLILSEVAWWSALKAAQLACSE